jgi:hypothetical protein
MDNADQDEKIERIDALLIKQPLFDHRSPNSLTIMHAGWPSYPTGDGLVSAVSTLAEYPQNTKFYCLSRIDNCTLYLVNEPRGKNSYSPEKFHVCLWDDDVVTLIEEQLVVGPTLIRDALEPESYRKNIEYPEKYLELSSKGRSLADIYELTHEVDEKLFHDVESHLVSGHYADAIRGASIQLEHALRSAIGSKRHGQALVDECFGKWGKLLSQEKCSLVVGLEIRSMYRKYFRYVRNEVAHDKPEFDLMTTCRLLRRCSLLLQIVYRLSQ